jgi:hypothetical protein
MSMNCHETLIEIADDCPAKEAQEPQARGAKKTKADVCLDGSSERIRRSAISRFDRPSAMRRTTRLMWPQILQRS